MKEWTLQCCKNPFEQMQQNPSTMVPMKYPYQLKLRSQLVTTCVSFEAIQGLSGNLQMSRKNQDWMPNSFWWNKKLVTFLGWLSDLQLGDQKVTLNHLVNNIPQIWIVPVKECLIRDLGR